MDLESTSAMAYVISLKKTNLETTKHFRAFVSIWRVDPFEPCSHFLHYNIKKQNV